MSDYTLYFCLQAGPLVVLRKRVPALAAVLYGIQMEDATALDQGNWQVIPTKTGGRTDERVLVETAN